MTSFRPVYSELRARPKLQRARVARLPPSRHTLYRRLRLFDRRTRRHPPLRTTFLLVPPGICHSPRLPTQRRRRSDPSDISPTRSQQSEGASSSLSPGPFEMPLLQYADPQDK